MASFIRHWRNKSSHLLFLDCLCNGGYHWGKGECEQTSYRCDGGFWCYIDGKSECPGAIPSPGAPWWGSCSACLSDDGGSDASNHKKVINVLLKSVDRGSSALALTRTSGIGGISNHKQRQGLGSIYNPLQIKQEFCLRRCGRKLCWKMCWIFFPLCFLFFVKTLWTINNCIFPVWIIPLTMQLLMTLYSGAANERASR